MAKTFALLVGINTYQPASGVKPLEGCLNDIKSFGDWLRANTPAADLVVLPLLDLQATRAAIIDGFRTHLGQARTGDTVVFYYCGHGARSASAPEFHQYFPVGKDEGLVAVDSRINGVPDLADKELAVLIAELGQAHPGEPAPHIAIILDCCHSGSGTRSAATILGARSRATYEVNEPRALESYLDGYYSRIKARGEPLAIPGARHILLAACERNQEAQESLDANDNSGFFTSALCAVLEKSKGELSYADLFVRCRAVVRDRTDDQNPQFQTSGGFDALDGFLGRSASAASVPYSVHHSDDGWVIDCGAINGLPTDLGRPVTLALFAEGDKSRRAVGGATAVRIGAQQSDVQLDFTSDPAARYGAWITSLPVAPLLVGYSGPESLRAALETAFAGEAASPLALTGAGAATDYAIAVADGQAKLVQCATGEVVRAVAFDAADPVDAAAAAGAVKSLTGALRHVAAWGRSLALSNPDTRLDTSLVDFDLHCEQLEDGVGAAGAAPGFTIEALGDKAQEAQSQIAWLTVANRGKQLLHAVLAYYSPDFGVEIIANEPIHNDGVAVPLWGGDGETGFTLEPGQTGSIENFKLFVSTEQIDGFLLEMAPLKAMTTRGVGKIAKVYRNEWFARTCRVRVVRRMASTGRADVALAGGSIVIKGNAAVTANIALSAARPPTRGDGPANDFHRALERRGFDLMAFGNTRGGAQNVLELSGITNTAGLRDNPLRIEIDVPLAINEAILPLVFDGVDVQLAGDVWKDDAGKTQISIDELPASAISKRSLFGAVKMYFFKTYLKDGNVNQLRRVEYLPEGGFAYRPTEKDDKHVAAAKNILLLVHGIIGDTEGMAAGVKACGVADKFDLVLTYDYESLGTLIGDTARALQAQLAAAGLHPDDGKSLTLLVHSMGGLVSRWFIECEGGKASVDHLVMCGTPNNGSPFGRIDGARKVAKMLTALALRTMPMPPVEPVTAVVSGLLAFLQLLLARSEKVTPALEQMNPDSKFIEMLNASPDPGVRYTILAGNIGDYEEPSDAFFKQFVTKLGQNDTFELLFGSKPNDIAVGVESILTAGAGRATPPVHRPVACHHLNYFTSADGQAALKAVPWSI